MTTEVIAPNEVLLNSVRYPLIGKVRPVLTSIHPEKQVIGDYTVLSDVNKSAWVIADQRGGVLIEEMDEKRHPDRCYFSTCNLGFKGHTFLPKLATAITIPTHTASAWNYGLSWSDPTSVWTDEDNVLVSTGYANSNDVNGWGGWIEVYVPSMSCSSVRFTWTESGANVVTGYDLEVYYNGAWNQSSYLSGGNPSPGTITGALGATYTVTKARVKFQDQTSDQIIRLSGMEFYAEVAAYQGNYLKQITFNSDEYLAWDNTLCKLDLEAGASFVLVEAFPTTITDIFADSSTIYVYLGDDDHYWYATPTTSSATLAEDLDASKTDVDVSDGTQFAYNDIIAIGSEEMLVTAIATNTLTVTRGYGSTAATHDDGAAITTTRFIETTADTHGQGATLGIAWDSKIFKIDSAGSMHLLTDPATTTPVESDKGDLPVDDNDLQRLFEYYNIDGDDVIYASTKKGVFVHDYANAKWLRSALKTPQHTNAGKGVCVWRDGAFISAGLDVIKYVPDVPAKVISMGLDRDDGLPVEYAGEITYMEAGYNEFYAAVDASQVSGTGYSTIMAYDDKGWQCKWADATADQAIYGMHVSSIYSYGLWFNAASTIYRIPLHRNLRNPLKISTDTYATSAMHLTPWFDADWQVGNKLALSLDVFAGGDVSAAENITVKYRIDHANTDRDTFGSVVKTIITSGLNTYTFGSSLGSAFKAIQFRFDLVRAAGSTTETPDILYAVLYYKKVLPRKWGYRFVVDCSRPYHGKTAKQLLDALVTAAELGTLTTFQYRDSVKYVEIRSVEGELETGSVKKGQYSVFTTEL